MAEHTYRNPTTGVHTTIGHDADLLAQGWERVDGPLWIVHRPNGSEATKPIAATDADAAVAMVAAGLCIDTTGWYATEVR